MKIIYNGYMVVIMLLVIGVVVGLGMHFLLPFQFSKLVVDAIGGVVGAVLGAIISSPFAPPNEIGQKITFVLASIIGAALAVFLARALKI